MDILDQVRRDLPTLAGMTPRKLDAAERYIDDHPADLEVRFESGMTVAALTEHVVQQAGSA